MTLDNDRVNREVRLNPFALPAETNVLFTLLVGAALALTFDVMNQLADVTGIHTFPQPFNLWTVLRYLAAPAGSMLVVLIVASILYYAYPWHIRRTQKLHRLTREQDARFSDELQTIVNVSGVIPSPEFEIDGQSHWTTGQVFGIRNHYALRLGRKLRLLLRKDPVSFRAIVLHELAHIANVDVSRTYFAQSIWIVFIVLVIIPSLAWLIHRANYAYVQHLLNHADWQTWKVFWRLDVPRWSIALVQTGATLAIVAAIRGSLLRTREMYADWRAALWGAEDSLTDLLRRNLSHQRINKWTRFWQLHPSAQERMDALKDPIQLFRITGEVPFFAGVLLGFVTSGLVTVLPFLVAIVSEATLSTAAWTESFRPLVEYYNLYAYPLRMVMIRAVFTLFIFGVLVIPVVVIFWMISSVVGSLSIEVQRAAIANVFIKKQHWQAYLSLWKPAIIAAMGLQMGIYLTPFSLLTLLMDLINLQGLTTILIVLTLSIGNALLIWLGLSYIHFFARRLLGTHMGSSLPRIKQKLLTWLSNGILVLLYIPAFYGQLIVEDVVSGLSETPLNSYLSAIFFSDVIVVFLYILIFAFTWFPWEIYRLLAKTYCPSCKQPIRKVHGIDQICEHCGEHLASWLYTVGQ